MEENRSKAGANVMQGKDNQCSVDRQFSPTREIPRSERFNAVRYGQCGISLRVVNQELNCISLYWSSFLLDSMSQRHGTGCEALVSIN
jgi:hypothetical protein